ncbi:MAG: nucleoside-diphosphate kinase [bacterium]
MSSQLERTLVLLKPDAVVRGLIGEVTSRFERVGLKILGLKLVQVDREFAQKHYTEDLAKRRGEHVRAMMVDFMISGPLVAMCLEGVAAIENVRKMIGATEPKAALPGTIRGDYTHMSYAYADELKIGIKNIVHASADANDAESEVPLWFKDSELCSYTTVNESQVW